MKETSATVLAALKNGPWREPAHAWLYEVRNKTGTSHGGRERYADAIVISCYPSRGLWIAGVEVKVSRSDWRAELDDPDKAGAIQRYCDYWWIVAADGVVQATEVPETWGHMTVSGTHVTKLKEAPRLDREPWTPQFLASLLRNASKAQDAHRKRGHEEGFAAAREVFGAEAVRRAEEKAFQAEEKLKDAERESKWQRRDLEALRERVANFERHAGLPPNTIASDPIAYGGVIAPGAGATFLAAQQIRHLGTERVISKLLAAVEALRALPEPPRPPEATSERTDPS